MAKDKDAMIARRLLLLMLVLGLAGCQTTARVGPTPAGYYFWLETIHSRIGVDTTASGFFDAANAELALVVSVESGQGVPLDGVLVEFLADPAWGQAAIVKPTRTLTKEGKARAVFRAFDTGSAPVVARVDTMTHQVIVTVFRGDSDNEP